MDLRLRPKGGPPAKRWTSGSGKGWTPLKGGPSAPAAAIASKPHKLIAPLLRRIKLQIFSGAKVSTLTLTRKLGLYLIFLSDKNVADDPIQYKYADHSSPL